MITCPNCGTENPEGSRFCAECGADLRTVDTGQQPEPSPSPASSIPPQFDLSQPPGQPYTWSSSEQPPPPEKKRRLWLWIVVGVLGACILFCCAMTIFASTDRGEEFFGDFGTRLSDQLTESAPTPTPRR